MLGLRTICGFRHPMGFLEHVPSLWIKEDYSNGKHSPIFYIFFSQYFRAKRLIFDILGKSLAAITLNF